VLLNILFEQIAAAEPEPPQFTPFEADAELA
jgi:hypothetical protein